MAGPHPEHRITHPVGHMRWETLSFIHWGYPPEAVRPLVPPELELDTYDGRAWVALTPFRMAAVRPAAVPAIPLWSTFPETNVRTYVRDRHGRDGLWFLTLECTRSLSVLARPAIGIPYSWARMSVNVVGHEVRYLSQRRWPPQRASTRIAVRPGEPFPDEELREFDHFLTGRWRAFSRRGGQLLCTPVTHEPWPLQRAEILRLEQNLVEACGLPAPQGEPVVHYSPVVHTSLGKPVLVR